MLAWGDADVLGVGLKCYNHSEGLTAVSSLSSFPFQAIAHTSPIACTQIHKPRAELSCLGGGSPAGATPGPLYHPLISHTCQCYSCIVFAW